MNDLQSKREDNTNRSNDTSGSISARVDAASAVAAGPDHVAGSQEAMAQAGLHEETTARVANEFDIKSAEVRISVAEANADMHRKEKEALVQQLAVLNQQVQLLQQGNAPSGPSAASSTVDTKAIAEASGKSMRRGSQGRKGKV